MMIVVISASSVVIGVLLIASGIGLYFFAKKKRRQARSLLGGGARYYSLSEYSGDDETLGIRVDPLELHFGSQSMQIPIDQDVTDKLTIHGIGHRTKFRLEAPPESTGFRCRISFGVAAGEVTRGREVSIPVTLRFLCTTSVKAPIHVIVPEVGYTVVDIIAESQLSSSIDLEDVPLSFVFSLSPSSSSSQTSHPTQRTSSGLEDSRLFTERSGAASKSRSSFTTSRSRWMPRSVVTWNGSASCASNSGCHTLSQCTERAQIRHEWAS